MYFVNSRKKFGFPFLTIALVLLAIVSITFGTIGSSAHSNGNAKKQEEKSSTADSPGMFGFLTNSFASFFYGSNFAQTSPNSQEDRSEKSRIANSPVFDEFNAWVDSYINNGFKASSEQAVSGEEIAAKRKQLLKELSAIDPQAALEKTIPAETLNRLPANIAANSEKRISAYGDFLVYVLDEMDRSTGQMNGAHRTERQVVIGDTRYKALVYGRREEMTTKLNIPLQGIVIDNVMVVDESPVRKLASAEFGEETSVEIGGKVVRMSSQSELDNFVNEQVEWESKIGPERPGRNSESAQPESTWTEGTKTVLVIRVDFSDKPGEVVNSGNQPFTTSGAQSLYTNEISPFYVNNSYNKTSIQATTVTSVVRMPSS